MFIKLGNTYTANIVIVDEYSNKVSTDAPTAIIKDIDNGLYWNGFMWSDNEFSLYMSYINNGVYCYQFTPSKAGRFEISISSTRYSISKTEMLEAYSTDTPSYQWTLGTPFNISCIDVGNVQDAKVAISRKSDNMYFDGSDWAPVQKTINMQLISDSLYMLAFTPQTQDEFSVNIACGQVNESYKINVVASGSINQQPVLIDSSKLMTNDGSDCVVVSDTNNPIAGVQVSAFDFSSKGLTSKTSTNNMGRWSMLLKPGRYFFVFEKSGFTSVSFDKVVV